MSHAEAGYSLSLLNAFISTVDHLPCDLIRSLWFIQTCNTEAEKLHQKLRDDLVAGKLDHLVLAAIRRRILTLEQEAIVESGSIRNQLLLQKHFLQTEKSQLERIKVTRSQQEIDRRLQLRETLEQHYRENPLKSQVEALKEQQLTEKKLHVKLEYGQSKLPRRKNDKTKLKLILKIPSRHQQPQKSEKQLKIRLKKGEKSFKVEKNGNRKKPVIVKTKTIPLPPTPPPQQEEEAEGSEVPEDEQVYCICKQPSFGNMIACDNKECPNGEWFHYKCVGLLNRVEALEYSKGRKRWYCSQSCHDAVYNRIQTKRQNSKKKRKGRHKW